LNGFTLMLLSALMAGGGPTSSPTIDLNWATIEQLLAFPGIGRLYAEKIVQARPFEARSELVSRDVMPVSAYLAIKSRLFVTRPAPAEAESRQLAPLPPGTLDLNRASRDRLLAVPGIGMRYADRIIAGRPYRTELELVARRIVPLNAFEQIQGFLVARR
jgi:competence protein ComEA